MTEWRKDVVHSCYGCKMYYPRRHPEGVGKPWSVKHCGGDHYKCDYFCNGCEPNVGVYVTRAVQLTNLQGKKKGEQE